MKTWITSILIASAFTATVMAREWPEPIAVPKGDYCADEAVSWIKNRLGSDTKIEGVMLEKSGCNDKQDTSCYRYNVWTNKCGGYFTFMYGFYSMGDCKRPQYGERTKMLHSVGAIGDCTRHLKGFDYPNE